MASISGLFTSIGHFFAKAVSVFLSVEPKIDAGAAKVEAAGASVEAVTAAIPVYGPMAVTIEKAGEMALGAIVGVIHSFGAAAQSNLTNAGLDITAIQTAQAVYDKLPSEVKAMVTPSTPAA